MHYAESVQTALVHLLQSGSVALPVVLLTEYHRVGLDEQEAMLLVQILIYQEKEHKPLPSVEEIATRMSISTEQIAAMLGKMLTNGYLQIDENNDTGLLAESYSLTPLWMKLAKEMVEPLDQSPTEDHFQTLFRQFEQELGRPLSPIECEMLSQWLDQDNHPVELIDGALQEAIFCNKVSFRYIDRILLEWKRNQIETLDQAMEHARRFRQKGLLYQPTSKKQEREFSFYNWVK